MKRVSIAWRDIAQHEGTWVPIEDVTPQHRVMHSVGWLVAEDERAVVVAMDYDAQEGNVAGVASIPKGCIDQIEEIKVGKATKISKGRTQASQGSGRVVKSMDRAPKKRATGYGKGYTSTSKIGK